MRRKLSLIVAIIASITAIVFFTVKQDDIKILFHTENDFGPVWVFEVENKRCMSFVEPPSDILQSCMLLDNPKVSIFHYTQIFLGSLFIQEQPKRTELLSMRLTY